MRDDGDMKVNKKLVCQYTIIIVVFSCQTNRQTTKKNGQYFPIVLLINRFCLRIIIKNLRFCEVIHQITCGRSKRLGRDISISRICRVNSILEYFN